MRPVPEELRQRIASGAATLCLCWRLSRRDGVTMGFTDHDQDLVVEGLLYQAQAALEGGAFDSALGLSRDSLRIDGALSSDAISAADIAAGRYDDAEIERWLIDWRKPSLRVLTFRGRLGEISRQGESFSAEVEGMSAALNRPVGRVYARSCDAGLGDARCGVDPEDPRFGTDAEIAQPEEDGWFLVSGADAYEAGWFDGGYILAQSGAAVGLRARVMAHRRDWRGDALKFWSAPEALAAGDKLRIVAGCDKTAATCRLKFNNILNFQGFPHMPGDDDALSYPSVGNTVSGGAS